MQGQFPSAPVISAKIAEFNAVVDQIEQVERNSASRNVAADTKVSAVAVTEMSPHTNV